MRKQALARAWFREAFGNPDDSSGNPDDEPVRWEGRRCNPRNSQRIFPPLPARTVRPAGLHGPAVTANWLAVTANWLAVTANWLAVTANWLAVTANWLAPGVDSVTSSSRIQTRQAARRREPLRSACTRWQKAPESEHGE